MIKNPFQRQDKRNGTEAQTQELYSLLTPMCMYVTDMAPKIKKKSDSLYCFSLFSFFVIAMLNKSELYTIFRFLKCAKEYKLSLV